MGLITGLVNAVGNIATAGINNAAAAERAREDRRENYMYGEMAANNADKRTRALYSDFYSPEALLRQYNEAGLSPSMMFGGTPGQGGMSGAQGTGASGIQTPYMPVSLVEAAQAAALFAQAEKTKEETKTERGENAKGVALLENIGADTGSKRANTKLTEVQTEWQEVENYYQRDFKDLQLNELEEQVNNLHWQAQSAMYTAKKDKLDFIWNKEMYDQGVNPYMENVKNMMADTLLKGAQKELTEEQVKEVRQHINYMIDDIFIRKMHLNNETFMTDFDKNLKEAEAEYYKKSKEIMGEVTNQDEFNKWMELGGRILSTAANVAALFFLKGKIPTVVPPVPRTYNGHKGMTADGWR